MSTLTDEQLNNLKKTVLLEKIGYLCEELGDPGRYFPELRAKNVLSTVDTQLIKSRPTDNEKTDEFVTLISKRQSSQGQHGLDVFVDALKKQRVHAHVARTLLRAYNKKKAEAERTSSGGSSVRDLGTSPTTGHALSNRHSGDSFAHTPMSDVSSNHSTASSGHGLEYHPEHGALPPSPPPPTSTQENNTLREPDGNIHPSYGLLPCPPPPSSTNQNEVSPKQEGSIQHPVHSGPLPPPVPTVSGPPNGHHPAAPYPPSATHSQCSDSELGPQSMAQTETTMSSLSLDDGLNSYSTSDAPSTMTSTRSSYPSMGSMDHTAAAELVTLRKEFETLKYEKKQVDIKYDEAMRRIHALETENRRLQDQVIHFQQQPRPSNLQFHPGGGGGLHHPAYHYPSPVSGNLTPPRPVHSTRNHSPGPAFSGTGLGSGLMGEKELASSLYSAHSSGSINSFSSRGSYNNPSESQV